MQLALSLAYLGAFCLLLTSPSPGHAAPARPDAGDSELPWHDAAAQGLDPIGLDESTSRELDQAAERLEEARRRAQVIALTPSAVRGNVLSSIDAVSEVAHRVHVQLAQGLAFVGVELVFASRALQPAELAYRLPLPADAAVYAIEVCRQKATPKSSAQAAKAPSQRCLSASPFASSAPAPKSSALDVPSLTAHRIQDGRGSALSLRVAAIDKSATISVQVSYVAEAPQHGGVVRFRLPARGFDPRVAQSEVALTASGFERLLPAAAVTIDAHLALDLRAERTAKTRAKPAVTQALCGGSACSRSYQASAAAAPTRRPSWLLLDTSPSMEGPARNAADAALASLLTIAPEGDPLRVFAFAARFEELGRFTTDSAPLKRLSDALLNDLGASTQPARALEAHKAELSRERPRVLLISDGKLDASALAALAAFKRRGSELWLIALSPQRTRVGLPFEGVISAHDAEGEALEERVRAAFSSQDASGLRAGEQRVQERLAKKPYTPRAGEAWLSHWLARDNPPIFALATARELSFVAAPAYESEPPKLAPAYTGMPKESVLSMLRSQLVPEARACLRSDRKGRANYAVGLTFRALFAEREAYEVHVEGRIPEALRSCLGDVVGRLRIPAFTGRIRVRYPIHTEREPEAPMIELEPDALEQVNRVISGK